MPTETEQASALADWNALTNDQRATVTSHFDADFYGRNNPHVAGDAEALLQHYLGEGWRQGRDPSPDFRTLAYLADNPELLASGASPFLFYLLAPRENRVPVDSETPTGERTATPVRTPLPPRPAGPISLEDAYRGLSAEQIAMLHEAFDAAYYRATYPDVDACGADPFIHFMTIGWIELRNPSEEFSTEFYLKIYPDIARAGVNPFTHYVLHGRGEKRASSPFFRKVAKRLFRPKIAAIIPNFNHGKFLPQRIESILAQTYPDIEITILDDCSTDNSREVIDDYVARYPGRIRKIYNEVNSGGVFRQWRKGIENTESDLVWICESDDFCEPDFAARLVPFFAADSVQIAFGRIYETDSDGNPNDWLDTYRELAEPGIWDRDLVRPAATWFAYAFGVSNVIANVGGCMWRRAPLSDTVWQAAASYRVVGDWYLYLQVASGGQIAWVRDAISYFRRHGANTSSSSFQGSGFYAELERFMLELRRTWDVPEATVRKFHGTIQRQYEDHFGLVETLGPLEAHCSLAKMLAVHRSRRHIVMAMLGFVPGGGENFPIQLANKLVEEGWTVSMLTFSEEVNEQMRRALNPAVSVYESIWVTEYGCDEFVRDAGVSLVHSHTIGVEMNFFVVWEANPALPFVVTLHGSYECSELPEAMWRQITDPVDHFVYTADKNLIALMDRAIDPQRFTKMANAMPIDPLPFPKTRAEMGIAEDAIVFTLVARGIKRKGWRAAIEAFRRVRERHPDRPMHLCLVGDGEVPDALEAIHGDDPDISFLGYQIRIHGLYRMTDVAVVPTRFVGESYPLCIIQSLQSGTPVIASDVGEIPRMLTGDDGRPGGLLVPAVRDTERFIADFADAMERMLDDDLRAELAAGATALAARYDMTPLVRAYGDIYRGVLDTAYGVKPMKRAA